jgi:MoaA/NifB/PqqE/SkfB family radical SAM enzyme
VIVVWRVTERCNLACGFCAYDRRLARPRADADPAAMLAFGAALAAYQRATGDRVLVSWLGGEPLLWRPLAGLTAAFAGGLGLGVSVTTNGTALASPGVRAHVLEHYAEVTVSVDGFAPVHDRLRGWPGGFAALRRAVAALAADKRRGGSGPLLRANVVLMRDNAADFERLCLELSAWGVEEITFNQLGGNDRPEFFPPHRLRPEDVDALAARLHALRARLAPAGTALRGGDRYVERIRSSAAGRRLPVYECDPGVRFLFVSERGVVAPCSFTADAYGVPIAELATGDDVAALPARFTAARGRRRAAVCDDCPSTQVFDKFDRVGLHASES